MWYKSDFLEQDISLFAIKAPYLWYFLDYITEKILIVIDTSEKNRATKEDKKN
jgi:hypothetical protein